MKALRLGLLLISLALIPLILAGCDAGWSVTARAWLDANGDGNRDPGEKPLAGIPIHGAIESISRDVTAKTNGNGVARLHIAFTDQHPVGEVFASVPPQYRLTTPGRVTTPSTSDEEPILFGFTYAPGFEPTPRPAVSVTCTQWELEGEKGDAPEIRDISLAADSSAWVAAGRPAGGYVHVRPDDPPGKLTLTPIAPKYPRQIAEGAGGDAWVATDEGLVRIHDGAQQVYLGAPFPEERDSLLDVAPLADGVVLVSGFHGGLALFDPNAESWTTHPFSNTNMTDLRRGYDGAVWGVGREDAHLTSLMPIVLPDGETANALDRSVVRHPFWYSEAAAAPDGAWWLSGSLSGLRKQDGDGLARFDPATRALTQYDRQGSPSPLDNEWIPSLDVAPDGGVFVGTTHAGLLRLDPESNTWRDYTSLDGLPSDYIGFVAAESANTVWIAACNPAGPECDYDDGNSRPLGWINLLARCTIGERKEQSSD